MAVQDNAHFKDRWRNAGKMGTRGRHHGDRRKKLEVARRRWWMIGGRSINRNKDKGQWRESKDRKKEGTERRDAGQSQTLLCDSGDVPVLHQLSGHGPAVSGCKECSGWWCDWSERGTNPPPIHHPPAPRETPNRRQCDC